MTTQVYPVRVRGALQYLAVVRDGAGQVVAHVTRWSEPFARRDAEAKAHAVGRAEAKAARVGGLNG